MQHHVILRNDEIILIHECFLGDNKQAKKIFLGVYHIFIQDQTTLEQQLLLEANKEGETNTKYGLAIALLCE